MTNDDGRSSASGKLLVFAALLAVSVACRGGAREARDVSVAWTAPSMPVVDQSFTPVVTLRDASGRPVRGARLELQAFMSHPGMAPVVAIAAERDAGVYRADLRFTMTGPWTVMVNGSLPDGRTLRHRVDIPDVRPPVR